MSSSLVQDSLSLTDTLKSKTWFVVATYNFADLKASPETPTLVDDEDPVSRAFCFAPLSLRRSPLIKIRVPLLNPTAIKLRSSSTAKVVGVPYPWLSLVDLTCEDYWKSGIISKY